MSDATGGDGAAREGPARVLLLTKGLGLGGSERLLTLTAARLDPRRFEVEVAYLLPGKDALVEDLRAIGIRVHCLAAGHTFDPRWVGRLHRLLRTRDFDLLHTHSPVPAAAARLLVEADTGVVHTEHNVWDRYVALTRLANAATYGLNDHVLAVSEGVAGSVRRPGWMPWLRLPSVETLHHGIDRNGRPRGPEARRDARERMGVADGRPLIGTVANFTPKKDHGSLVAAIDLLRRSVPELQAVLIGSGPREQQVREQVADRGLDGHVSFLGTRHDVPRLLPGLDLFVLSSRYEGLAIALLEALAAGVPCVATRVGGIPEAVQHGTHGLLVPPGDPPALAGAVRELLDDPSRRERMGHDGAEHLAAHFSIDRATHRIEAVYDRVLRVRG